jgi:catechol 2,3-dioxygenase-like lactoylglutathione lyase family enzyme
MPTRYAHTNLISADWQALARFYEAVFDCVPVPPVRDQTGEWLDRGTGVTRARLQGMHLRLPGHGDAGPTLEIYQYDEHEPRLPPAANRLGIGHLAFQVDDVATTREAVLGHGGADVGQVSTTDVAGVGTLVFVYLADPDGNLIEVQSWS